MKTILRIIVDILVFASVVYGWWFVFVPLSVFGLATFPRYFEIIVAGIMYDSLFGFAPGLGVRGYLGTAISIFLFVISSLTKRMIRK